VNEWQHLMESNGLRNGRSVLGRHQLELRLDADPFWMSPLRALVSDLAIRADFDLDAVSDLTLAVDEACAVLISAAHAGERLKCRFLMAPDEITVVTSLPGATAPNGGRPAGATAEPEPCRSVATDTFGWQVMDALTDRVELTPADGADGGMGIRITKHRTAPHG
jgi:serine/threonine-protein kinase RsbW